jgi:cell wall-associated NlpC family hydrolase
MTVNTDSAIAARWQKRLAARRRLLADARKDLEAAKTPEEKACARARVALRKQQIADARAVLERHTPAATTVRERVVRAAMLGVKHRDQIHYSQDGRRWEGIAHGLRAHQGRFPRWADCSSFVTWCLWDALGGSGAGPDIVNGAAWKGGYTGTQIGRGREVPIGAAREGDLAFYGTSRSHINHVTIVVAPGRVVSHGQESGPSLVPINYDRGRYGGLKFVRRYLP